MNPRVFSLKWSVSRGRETQGNNILTARDDRGLKVARCMGGGYDMTGTVIATVLTAQFSERLKAIAIDRADSLVTNDVRESRRHTDSAAYLYGLTAHVDSNGNFVKASVDGACGVRSVERIAEAMGVTISYVCNRRGQTTAFVLTEAMHA